MSFREWAGLAASLAGLAGFLGGIAITQEAIVALGVMGLVYLGVGLAAAAFTLGDALIGGEGVDSERVRSALFTLFVIGRACCLGGNDRRWLPS